MGSSGSKAARETGRKFPARLPGVAIPPTAATRGGARQPHSPPPPPPPPPPKDQDVTRPDSSDYPAGFSRRLHEMGIARPNPTFSPSSTASPTPDAIGPHPGMPSFPAAGNNATLGVLEARRRLQQRAEAELASPPAAGREFLDVRTIREVLALRDRGRAPAEIEAALRLKQGVVRRLGPPGVVTAVGDAAAS